MSRKYSVKFSPMELTYAMMAMGAVFFNFVSIGNNIRANTLAQYFLPLKNRSFLISLAYLGVLSSIIAGVILLHESFKLYHFIGYILILVGVWGTNYYSSKGVLKLDY